jgi:transglutaminase-like putative cysteine protease
MFNCMAGQAFSVSSKNAIAIALILAIVVAPFIPEVQAQSQYKVNEIACTVNVLDGRSARVAIEYNFTWLEAPTYVDTWLLALDSHDAHGIVVKSQGNSLDFESYAAGDATSLEIELGRNVGVGQWMCLTVEYVTSSNIETIGPERRLSMSIWESAPIDRINLTVMIPEGFCVVSYKPSFLEEADWGDGLVLTGVGGGASPGTYYHLFASYAGAEAEYNMTYNYAFTNVGALAEHGGEFEVPVFAEAPYQTVTQLSITPDPMRLWYDDSGNYRAKFRFETILPGETANIVITYSIRTTLPARPDSAIGGGLDEVPPEFLVYTEGEEYWEVGDESISVLASDLTSGGGSVLEMSKAIFEFIVQNITYDYAKYHAVMMGMSVERYGAVQTLELGRGVCEDITDLYIALCRAAGIPAVEVVGFAYSEDGVQSQGNRHAWVEVFIPGYGWMDVDPTWELFGRLDGRHVGDRMFMNSSEPSYLVWSTRQSFEYDVESHVSIRGEGVYYQPLISLSASHAGEAYKGIVYPLRLIISNGGNGTAFDMQGEITWSGNVGIHNESIIIGRIWGYDYRNVDLLVEPYAPGNATINVHLEYTGEGGGEAEEDYSITFLVTEKPAYSIEGLVASLDPNTWYLLGGSIAAAIMVSLAAWATRRAKYR